MQAFSGSKICLSLLGVLIIGTIGTLIYVFTGSGNILKTNVPESLVMVHVVFRHGDKNPDKGTIFPKSPLVNETYYPYGVAQLSKKGRRNAYILGEQINERYGAFLGNTFYPGLFNAVSSNRQRTRMSLSLLLASLFPPSDVQKFSSLNWQPILSSTIPLNEDKAIYVKNACPAAFEVYTNHSKEDMEFFEFLQENTGFLVDNLRPVYLISVYLKENAELGLPTPDWAKNVLSKIHYMGEIRHWVEVIENNLPLLSGHLMGVILNNTREALDDPNNIFKTKMFLYSGHYHNVIGMLGALDCYKEEFIEYSSQIILEVHLINATYGIKAFFQNGPTGKIRSLKLPFCEEFCPLEVFEDYQNKNIISKRC